MNHTFVPDDDAGLLRGIASIKNVNHPVIMSGRKSSPSVGRFGSSEQSMGSPFMNAVHQTPGVSKKFSLTPIDVNDNVLLTDGHHNDTLIENNHPVNVRRTSFVPNLKLGP